MIYFFLVAFFAPKSGLLLLKLGRARDRDDRPSSMLAGPTLADRPRLSPFKSGTLDRLSPGRCMLGRPIAMSPSESSSAEL